MKLLYSYYKEDYTYYFIVNNVTHIRQLIYAQIIYMQNKLTVDLARIACYSLNLPMFFLYIFNVCPFLDNVYQLDVTVYISGFYKVRAQLSVNT